MDAGLALQYAIVALAVVASAIYVFRTRFPGAARRLRGWLAIRMIDSGVPALTRMGRRLAPAPATGGACGTCGGCDPAG